MSSSLISKLFSNKPTSAQQREINYLSQSVSMYDLERRQRELASKSLNRSTFGLL